MTRFLVVAGDPSGDLLASQLVTALKKARPGTVVAAVGGQNLERVSDRFLANIVKQHAMGFAISPAQISTFRNVLNDVIAKEIDENKPDAVIPVDFHGFNSYVCKLAKSKGTKVLYYASPQFYASRPWRADRLRPYVDLFLCLFPFEKKFFEARHLPVQFVGHPILDHIPLASPDRPARIEPVVGLLPGSRAQEIRRHLPVMLGACERVAARVPGARFLVFTVPHVDRNLYHQIIASDRPNRCLIELIQDEHYTWRSQLDLAIAASGFETFENAMLGIPTVIMYKTNWFTYFLARAIIRVRFLGMPNLLADNEVMPEFIQWQATPENVAKPLLKWIEHPDEQRRLRHELLAQRQQFGESGASERAANVILAKVA